MGRAQGEDEIQKKPSQLQPSLRILCIQAQGLSVPEEIIGGTESKPHSRPYMAHLEILTLRNHLASCGGFLIRRNFVLTAAHCAGR